MKTPAQRLGILLGHLRLAVYMAQIQQPTARGFLGIGWRLPDGTGALVCDFDSAEFVSDLEAVLAQPVADQIEALTDAHNANLETAERRGIHWLGSDKTSTIDDLLSEHSIGDEAGMRESYEASDLWVWLNPYSQEINNIDELEWANSESAAEQLCHEQGKDI